MFLYSVKKKKKNNFRDKIGTEVKKKPEMWPWRRRRRRMREEEPGEGPT